MNVAPLNFFTSIQFHNSPQAMIPGFTGTGQPVGCFTVPPMLSSPAPRLDIHIYSATTFIEYNMVFLGILLYNVIKYIHFNWMYS